jgi:putative effector of murein hydrolase
MSATRILTLGRHALQRSGLLQIALCAFWLLGEVLARTLCLPVPGACGAALGEVMLKWLPLRSSLAGGALFGLGAHGAGVAKAQEIGAEEGSIAGLGMILTGLFNVLAAPVLAYCLR